MNVSAPVDDVVPLTRAGDSPAGGEGGIGWVNDQDRNPDDLSVLFLPT